MIKEICINHNGGWKEKIFKERYEDLHKFLVYMECEPRRWIFKLSVLDLKAIFTYLLMLYIGPLTLQSNVVLDHVCKRFRNGARNVYGYFEQDDLMLLSFHRFQTCMRGTHGLRRLRCFISGNQYYGNNSKVKPLKKSFFIWVSKQSK